MRTWFIHALAAALSVGLSLSASAQQAEPEIIVRPPPTPEVARTFVDSVTAVTPQRQMARWDRSVCIGMYGMRGDLARAIIDRISMTVRRVGLEAGEPGCEANVMIFFIRNSDEFAAQLAEMRRVMGVRSGFGDTLGRDALRAFADTPRPVRWWHVAQTHNISDGQAVGLGEAITVQRLSRLRRATRQDLDRVFIIIDAERVSGVQGEALADYLTMAALAQVSLDADLSSAHTILTLFSDLPGPNPETLTEWDIAYLEGLYSVADRDAISNEAQERSIARHMSRELGDGQN